MIWSIKLLLKRPAMKWSIWTFFTIEGKVKPSQFRIEKKKMTLSQLFSRVILSSRQTCAESNLDKFVTNFVLMSLKIWEI